MYFYRPAEPEASRLGEGVLSRLTTWLLNFHLFRRVLEGRPLRARACDSLRYLRTFAPAPRHPERKRRISQVQTREPHRVESYNTFGEIPLRVSSSE
jgi:hypothetical protein